MKSFDIDAFLSQTFKDIEDKEKSSGKNKKNKNKNIMNIQESKKEDNPKENKMTIDNINSGKIDIFNDNKIDMNIYNKISLESIKNEKNIQLQNLIKPMFPNDEVYQKEFTPDKIYIIDKFINRSNKKNKKKQMKLNYTHNMIKNLKKEKMNYEALLPLNNLWQDYITELINNSNNEENILNKILKADLHGALLTVKKSTNKNNIGISGIVLFESKRTFNLLTEKNTIKTILKNGCIFETKLNFNNMNILIYGDNFIYKSAERTKIKFKQKFYFNFDLFSI